MTASTFTRNNWVDALVNADAFSVTTVWVSLHTADPGDTGANEVSGGSYARQSASFAAAASGSADTDAELTYNDMPAATITHVGLWDSETGGNFLGGGAFSSSESVESGQDAKIESGDLTVSIS